MNPFTGKQEKTLLTRKYLLTFYPFMRSFCLTTELDQSNINQFILQDR